MALMPRQATCETQRHDHAWRQLMLHAESPPKQVSIFAFPCTAGAPLGWPAHSASPPRATSRRHHPQPGAAAAASRCSCRRRAAAAAATTANDQAGEVVGRSACYVALMR